MAAQGGLWKLRRATFCQAKILTMLWHVHTVPIQENLNRQVAVLLAFYVACRSTTQSTHR